MKTTTLPETKLNELAQQVSAKMLAQHTFTDGMIRGDELKQFAGHKQINKFLIFQVYQVWEMQMNKLKHPYFNLEHADIASTLQALKNQISQHIEVSSDDFRPMLERAVYNNLKLLVDPEASFTSFFFAQKEVLPLNVYERFSQFFSDMDFIVNSILRYFQKNQLEEVEKDVFFSKMNKVVEVYNRKSEKGFDAYRADLFEEISGQSLQGMLEEVEAERIRLEAEREAEEARKKAAELAMKKAELEAQRQAEEKARQEAEEEAKRVAEEARRKEEEERKKAEEAAKKLSFFDTISTAGDSFFDLDEDDTEESAIDMEEEEETREVEAEVEDVVEETVEETVEEVEEMVEELEEEIVAEVEEEEVIEETQEEEVAEIEEEVVEEMEEEVEEVVEEIAEQEETVEEVVEEAVEEVEELVEETAEESPDVEKFVEETVGKFDEEEFQEMVENMQPEEVAEEVEKAAPTSILDKVSGNQESKATYLDQFLNNKSNGTPQETVAEVEETPIPVEVDTPSVGDTVFDRVNEKPQTIADQYKNGQQSNNPIHDSVTGNRKIKLDEIPIHKQYQYVQKVFDGNNVRFRIIVDKVNNAKNKDEVEDILGKFVLSNDSLDQADGVVSEFIGLLRNRF